MRLLSFTDELGRVADLGDAVGERGRDRERGDLVDHVRDLVARDRRAVQLRRAHAQLADRFAARLARRRELDVGAHALQHVDEPDPGGVARHRLEHDVGTGRDRGRDHEERGRRRVAGHVELERPRRARRARAPTRPSTATGAPSAASIRSV